MRQLKDISPQEISWVKSNREAFENSGAIIHNLYYPESIEELSSLIRELYGNESAHFIIIGYSSNTLFLPSFSADHVICTKYISQWNETENEIICECGVNIAKLSRAMVEKGYVGFEGLTDLPGTIAAGVYGNCGCRGCSVNALVNSIDLLLPDGNVTTLNVDDLKLKYRSTSLKRGELQGTILWVRLKKEQGDIGLLKAMAEKNHNIRKATQPSGANNLGTTFNGGSVPTLKGRFLIFFERLLRMINKTKDSRVTYPMLLNLIGKKEFVPYVYYWNRYMFLDAKSHLLFPKYIEFVKSLYKDVRLEIEIKR